MKLLFFANVTPLQDAKLHMNANLAILATPACIIGRQAVSLGHLGGFVAF